MGGQKVLGPCYITTMNNKQTHTGVIMTNKIYDTIQAARSNPSELLALASSETLDLVAGHYRVSAQYAAPKTAQRLFNAKKIAIKSVGQPGSRSITKVYDLTNCSQAYDALETWGVRSRSNAAWLMCEGDANRYYEMATADGEENITRHVTSFLQLIRK